MGGEGVLGLTWDSLESNPRSLRPEPCWLEDLGVAWVFISEPEIISDDGE